MKRFAIAMVLLGCHTAPPPPDAAVDDAAVSDALLGIDASFPSAPHAPTIIPDQGGARMAHPQLVIITYADDANRAALEAHAAWLTTSDWLTSVGAEYGVGTASLLANVRRTDNAPDMITNAGIEALIAAGIADYSLPAATDGSLDEVLYIAYFPRRTMITDPSLGQSCVAYGGYHFEGTSEGRAFSYAVIPSCTSFNPALNDLEFEEETVAHELIEAATDALPETSPAFTESSSGPVYSPWVFVGSEVADLCALHVGAHGFARYGEFVASRVWSNAAAMVGNVSPCIPADPASPFLGLAMTPATAQVVPAGGTVTFQIQVWTSGTVEDFQIYPVDSAQGTGAFVPTLSLDRTMVNNGQTAMLTVGVPATAPRGQYSLIYVEPVRSAMDYDGVPVVVIVQ